MYKKIFVFFVLVIFTNLLFSYSEKNVCEVCDGSGIIRCDYCNGNGNRRCKACDGNGWYVIEYNFLSKQSHEHKKSRYSCATCNGRGNVECFSCRDSHFGAGKQICYKCLGQGYKITNFLTGDKEICITCQGEGSIPCSKCGSDGRVDCTSCNGMGYFEER